jgi:hypothetical protein
LSYYAKLLVGEAVVEISCGKSGPDLPPFGTILWEDALMIRQLSFLALVGMVAFAGRSNATTVYTIDFETEDDFVTPLVHGQAIYSTARPDRAVPDVDYSTDTVLEFGNLFNVRSTIIGVDGHLGPVIFDTDPADNPPAATTDDDLLVGLGNILVLQRDESPITALDATYGLRFTDPNDEASHEDRGTLIFDFLVARVHPISIDLVDVDLGVTMDVILTDNNGRKRSYDIPFGWTTDITVNPGGYQTLDLETLLNQQAEALATGGDATAVENAGFNAYDVVKLEVRIVGGSPSGGVNNLVFGVVPEPCAIALAAIATGMLALVRPVRKKA